MTAVEPEVFVIDDDDAVRDALGVHLDLAGFRVRGFASAEAFLGAVGRERPGCAVVDIRMPGMDGLALQRELARRGYLLPVIVITGHGDVPAAATAFRAGAVDFLQKPFDEEVLIERIREALARDARARLRQGEIDQLHRLLAELSPREREVMGLVARGLSNKQVALRLGIGVRTVESHRAKVIEKTGARSAAELARIAMAAEVQ